jgi:aminoacyl tRNA synthase complex-interacting multifunctional protein 1
MQDRRVIVICNLKPRNLVGFKSNGMVLCAVQVKEDGSEVVELLSPPASAQPGDRVVGQGLIGEPLSASQCDKKKAFEAVAPLLKLVDGIATWDGVPLVTPGGEAVSAPTLKEGILR